MALVHQLGGTWSAAQAVVGDQGGPAGSSSSQRPGLTYGVTGALLRHWSVLKQGVAGTTVPNRPGTLASGDGESCLGGGWCSRRTCGRQQLPTARAH